MFICSITLTKERIALLLVICLVILLIAGVLVSSVRYDNFRSNKARIHFLKAYIPLVDDKPFSTETLTLPDRFDSLWESYEALQIEQGFSLVSYRGKQVTKYTYLLPDDPQNASPVYANLLVYRGKLIACDLTCPDFQSGWVKPLISSKKDVSL